VAIRSPHDAWEIWFVSSAARGVVAETAVPCGTVEHRRVLRPAGRTPVVRAVGSLRAAPLDTHSRHDVSAHVPATVEADSLAASVALGRSIQNGPAAEHSSDQPCYTAAGYTVSFTARKCGTTLQCVPTAEMCAAASRKCSRGGEDEEGRNRHAASYYLKAPPRAFDASAGSVGAAVAAVLIAV